MHLYLRNPRPKYPILVLEFRTFDRSLLDSQLLAKSQILQDQIASVDKQATKQKKQHFADAHLDQLFLIMVSFLVVFRESEIVRKSLCINKDGIFGRDR